MATGHTSMIGQQYSSRILKNGLRLFYNNQSTYYNVIYKSKLSLKLNFKRKMGARMLVGPPCILYHFYLSGHLDDKKYSKPAQTPQI